MEQLMVYSVFQSGKVEAIEKKLCDQMAWALRQELEKDLHLPVKAV